MDVPPIRYVTARDGTRISYVSVPGESPPFLFAYTPGSPHISLKAKSQGYFGYIREFCRERAWVTFDCRGTGLSDPIEGTLTLSDLVADLDAITEAIGEPVDAWTAFGGSMVVCPHAAEHPERYRSIWLRSPFLNQAEEGSFARRLGRERDYHEQLRVMLVALGVPLANAARFASAMEKGVPQESFLAYRAVIADVDLTGVLPRLEMPVWVTAGLEYQHRAAARVAALLPKATLSIWDRPEIQIELGDWTREDWEQNLGVCLSDSSVSHGEDVISHPECATGWEQPGTAAMTERELEILRMLALGLSNRAIAEVLVITPATVASHVRHILQKTGTANRAEATAFAVRAGLA